MRNRKNYEEWEKIFIRLSYPIFKPKEIADHLNRKVECIKTYTRLHGIYQREKNIIGRKFRKLTVIDRAEQPITRKKKEKFWLCKCECGNTTILSTCSLQSGGVQSCGCMLGANMCKTVEYVTGTNLCRIIRRARKKNIEYNIDAEYLNNLIKKQNFKCAITGLSINLSKNEWYRKIYIQTASLDRIDSSKGYIKGNVWWVHKDVNFMKQSFPLERLLEISQLIINNKEKSIQWQQQLAQSLNEQQ